MNISKNRKKIIALVSLVLFIVIVPTIAYMIKKSNKIEVKTISISKNIDNIITLTGTVSSEEKKEIYLDPTKGSNYTINVKKGDVIESGATLISYDSESIDSKISNTKEAIKSKKDALSTVKNSLENAKKSNDPMEASKVSALEEKISMSEADIKTTESTLKEFQNGKKALEIKSPIGGTVTAINSGAQGATPIIVIQSNGKIVKSEITEYEISKVKLDTKAQINFKSLGEEYTPTKIVSVANTPTAQAQGLQPAVQSKISNYEIILEVPKDISESIYEGFHSLIKLGDDAKPIEIPKNVVYKDVDEETKLVWVVKENKLVSKEIKVHQNGDILELVEGLEDGDVVVCEPSSKLRTGAEVSIL